MTSIGRQACTQLLKDVITYKNLCLNKLHKNVFDTNVLQIPLIVIYCLRHINFFLFF